MNPLSLHFAVVAAVYFAVVLGIGVFGMRKTKTEEDFLTAGRSIGPWVGGAVLAATQISAGTLVGTVGRHYSTGVSWVWVWPGVWCGWLVSAIFVGPKLREFGAVTIPAYLAARFRSETARLLSAIFIIFAYMILLVAQYQACGVVFESIFGIRPVYAMAILTVSTLLYTTLGGVRSSSYIDFLQILIVVSGLVLSVPVLVYMFGGLNHAGAYLRAMDTRITGSWYNGRQLFGFALSFGLAIAAAPYEMVRFNSMRDKATVRNAIGVCFIFQALIGSCVLIMGLMTRALFPALPSPDQASSIMALNVLPPLVGSLFMVALLSAIMSNVNAILLVASAGVAHDIYGKFINRRASESVKLLVNRASIVALSLAPVWFALNRYTDVQSIVVVQTRFIASFFFVPMIIGLNTRGGNSASAVSSMAGGVAGCLAWSIWTARHASNIDAVEVGIACSALSYFAVNAFTRSDAASLSRPADARS
ncbi:MAG TPA: sodium:solute symporter family protein [Terriglobales bacterium]|nr:sodium:solute symporter family protein [Terriglobales bacterium]